MMVDCGFRVKETPMKFAVLAVLFLALLCAQQPAPPVQVTPGTPAVGAPQAAPHATPPVEIKPDTVVMEANGKKYTKAEVDHLIALLPPQYQTQALVQPQVLTQLLVYQKLADDALKEGLDKRSPYQEQLELTRTQLLAQAELTIRHNTIVVTEDDQKKYFADHPEKFQEAKVRVIQIAFNPAPDKTGPDGKKLPVEAEAKAKIEDLRKQIVAGADFGKLARENSDDKTSAGKDGDFGAIKHNSPYPEPIKAAVFALKPGEMSPAIRLPNGFYLIRLDELHLQSFDEVSGQIIADIQQERFQDFTKSLTTQFAIKVENPAYFAPKPPPTQLQQVR
jgi:parvulin-like peptidyl-prolyl isomerase